jgi:hypothetical protein
MIFRIAGRFLSTAFLMASRPRRESLPRWPSRATVASLERFSTPIQRNRTSRARLRLVVDSRASKKTMLQRSMTTITSFSSLTDDDLLARVRALAGHERVATAELVASLAELDARRLYLGAGCSSLFTYCTRVLRLSESAAYARIEAARATRRFPQILDRLADGRLTLSAVCLLGRVLTVENQAEILDAAAHKSKREIEAIVARVRPLPPVPATVRKLPATNTTVAAGTAVTEQTCESAPLPLRVTAAPAPTRLPQVKPLAPEIYKVQFTLSREGHDRLRRAQDLLRHVVPDGNVAAVFERALTLLVEDLERRRLAATARPRAASLPARRSRDIPAAVRREVWKRDGGQCAFVGTLGRCTERGFLEIHHVVPYADGGAATVKNLQLRCAAHNAYEAALWSGADIARERVACEWR